MVTEAVSRTRDEPADTLLPLHFNSEMKYRSHSSSGQVVAVMQAAKFGRRYHPVAHTAVLGWYTTRRSLLVQCEMRSIFVAVADVLVQQAFQMPFIHSDHVLKEIHGLRKLVRFGWMPKLFTVSMTSSLKSAP